MQRYTPKLTPTDGYQDGKPIALITVTMLPDESGEWVRYSDFLTSGAKGGSAKTDAKVSASRENGKKGGRPRKVKEE